MKHPPERVFKNVKEEEVKITNNDTDGGRFLTFERLRELNSEDVNLREGRGLP